MSYKLKSPLPVFEGGTGAEVLTAYAVLCGGVSATDAIQPILSVGSLGYVLTSNGPGALPTFQASSGGGITGISGDLGGFQTGPDISIEASATAGSTVFFDGSANVISLKVTDVDGNTIIGEGAGNPTVAGNNNTVLGKTAGEDLTVGTDNTLIGFDSGASLTSGSFNVLLGSEAGSSYVSNESSNIIINASGTVSDDNTLRIGSATGTGNGELNKSFIQGIRGITPTINDGIPIFINSVGQLGTVGTGGGITSIEGDTGGPQSGPSIVFDGSSNSGSSVSFSGSGNTLTLNVSDSIANTIIGLNSGNGSISGVGNNTVFGANSGNSITSGFDNSFFGEDCCASLTSGSRNTIIGMGSGTSLLTGTYNVILGQGSGDAYIGGETSNIILGANVNGTVSESNTLRIGASTGVGNGQLSKAFISGINGVNVGSVATVVTESGNQLGTAVITAGSGISVTPGANTITIAATGGGAGITSIEGDIGGPQTGSAITFTANATCGSTVEFSGAADTIVLDVTDALHNTMIGLNAGNAGISGNHNIGLGDSAGTSATMAGDNNIMIGSGTGANLTSGAGNVTVGINAGNGLTSGNSNVLIGLNAGANASITGAQNVAIGSSAGASLTGGLSNVFVGPNAGASETGGTGNIAIGSSAGASLSGATGNIFIGSNAGASLVGEDNNIAIGLNSGSSLASSCVRNVLMGSSAGTSLAANTTDNTFVGYNAGNSISSGTRNVIMGANAATNLGAGESSNIIINDNGSAPGGNSNMLFIGAGTGTGNFQLNSAFISGINGITVTGTAVLVSASDQLGIAVSTRKMKHDIENMNDASSAIMQLRPVTFVYNNDEKEQKQYGLIAEEVNEILPDIVVFDKQGEPQTVQYHVLPVLLLNELQKLAARVAELEAR
jgi:hypothetical protein